MIPCKENKCILLPVCKYKTQIRCDDLRIWFQDAINPWFQIREVIPKIVSCGPRTLELNKTLNKRMRRP